jgi:hypothetical protein
MKARALQASPLEHGNARVVLDHEHDAMTITHGKA